MLGSIPVRMVQSLFHVNLEQETFGNYRLWQVLFYFYIYFFSIFEGVARLVEKM